MARRSVAVQAFKVELRAASILQFRRIGMGSQNRPVSRNIVSNKLAKDGPTCGGITQGIGRVIDLSDIAETACAAERVQELLIRLKRRQLGKHSSIACRALQTISSNETPVPENPGMSGEK